MYGFQPKSARIQNVQAPSDAGAAPFGSRGVAAVRELIPRMQAMGFRPQPPAPAPADTSGTARLRAMIPQMEAMGYKQEPQFLADGGMVHSIKGMLGLRPKTREEMLAADARAQERNREAAARVADRSARQPATAAPVQQSAISDYTGMTALQRREKEQGLKDGGAVKPHGFKAGGLIRGPGTGTSDSIEAKKRPGTFIMPADSTNAFGPEMLDGLGEPEEMGPVTGGMDGQGQDDAGAGEAVPVRVSNGEFEFPPERVQALGEAVLTVMRDATHERAGESQEAAPQAAGFSPRQFLADGGTVQDDEKKRLSNQTAMYVRGAQAQAASRPAAPNAPAVSPQASAAPRAAGFMPGTRAVVSEAGKAIGDLASQGRYGAAAGETARAALATGPAMVDDVVGGALRAVAPAVLDAGKQFFGVGGPDTQASPGGVAATPNVRPAVKPVQAVAPEVATMQSDVGGPSTESPTEPRNGGQISADNANADSAMTGQDVRQSAAGVQQAPAGFVPVGLRAPVVRNSTNDWAARKALENAATSASSITNNGGKFDRSGPGDSASMAGYKAALATDQALQLAQPGMEQTALRENGANQRAALQDAGATARTVIQDQGATSREAGRTALGQGELELRRTAAGFQTRAAAQLESLQNAYANEKDPTKQAGLARQIREIQGKEQPARYKVAAGGQQIDANGVAYKVPDRVFNEQTGQFADGAATAAPTKARPVGTTSTVNGKTAVWDGEKWVPRG